jgi:adenosylhomocysteine nucleosidase
MEELYNANLRRYNLKCFKHEWLRESKMKTVVLVSAIAEWNAVKPLFPDVKMQRFPFGECFDILLQEEHISFFHSGWGKIASSGSMQYVIDQYSPDLVVNLGTCGGFEGEVNQGEIILVEKTYVYDIVELMGDLDIVSYYGSSLDLSWLAEPYPYPVRRGMIASADSDLPPAKIPSLKARGAIAADWESAALAWVAQRNQARLLILRGVSDLVSEEGGEAYNNIEMFNERAKGVMQQLIEQLPEWLNAIQL